MNVKTLCAVLCFWVSLACAAKDCNFVLELPWHNYTAHYEEVNKDQICVFRNVKFGYAPRFQKPVDPTDDKNRPKKPVSCPIAPSDLPCTGGSGPSPPTCPKPIAVEQEDCHYLDIYVPLDVLGTSTNLPVVVWIYGGAYTFGSKDNFDLKKAPFYSGSGPVTSAALANDKEKVIFVAGNYRLGAWGWLAGTTMENDATPNLGLYDQFKVFEFVQRFIKKVNGDPSQVSAWGESAGASSLLHHVLADNGTRDLGFNTAVLQSAAFEWQWDRNETMENTYKQFAALLDCTGSDTIKCLQSKSFEEFNRSNVEFIRKTISCTGLFPIGPSLDGKLLHHLPPVAFAEGLYNKNVKALVLSNVLNEVGKGFIPPEFQDPAHPPTEATFNDFLHQFIPEPCGGDVINNIETYYPSSSYNGNQTARVIAVILHSTFTCNTMYMFEAYHDTTPTWIMNYGIGGAHATHASDLIPTFFNDGVDAVPLLECVGIKGLDLIGASAFLPLASPIYQSVLTSLAKKRDPNTDAYKLPKYYNWTQATVDSTGNYIDNVMSLQIPSDYDIRKVATSITLKTTSRLDCEFWRSQAVLLEQSAGCQLSRPLVKQDVDHRGSMEL